MIMSDETGEILKISMVVMFAAALVTSVIMSSRNTKTILDISLDKASSSKGYVSSTNIISLQNRTRTPTDLYKIYSTYEESINSITGYIGEGSVKDFKIFYLRSGSVIDKELYIINAEEGEDTYNMVMDEAKAEARNDTGFMCNIDRMSSDLLTNYGFDSFAQLQCYITRTTDHNGYDIYFYDLRE